MPNSKLIEIVPWDVYVPGDVRGPTVGLNFENKRFFVVIKRFAGVVGGKHYHKGTASSKNPELLFLFDGEMKLVLQDMKNGNREELNIIGPVLLKIPPFIYHEVHPITDITFIEFNEEESDFKFDTVWPTEEELKS
jgi:hypothetical protein